MIGFYKVLKWVDNLAYQLELSEIMQIHNIVLVIQFEPYSEADLYEREFRFNFGSIKEQDSNSYYKINAVIDKKMIYESSQYKIKWTGYDSEKNTWLWSDNIQMKDLIQKYEEKQHWTINEKGCKWEHKWNHWLDKTFLLYYNWISNANTLSPVKKS